MKICSVYDAEFARYGRVHSGIESAALLREMEKIPLPESGTAYEPSIAALEACEAFADYRTSVFGGMPVQLGMCWGAIQSLTALNTTATANSISVSATLSFCLPSRTRSKTAYSTPRR